MCKSTAPATPCNFCSRLFAKVRLPSTLKPTICTSMGDGKPKFNIWVIMSAGRKENVVEGKPAASFGQCAVSAHIPRSADDRR